MKQKQNIENKKGENKMKEFTAVTKNGLRITTVLASDEYNARDEIIKQLSHPGRTDALGIWTRAGQPIKIFKSWKDEKFINV